MKTILQRVVLPVFLAMALIVSVVGSAAATVPTITINSVEKDASVTISGKYFPKNQTFTVRMGPYGTYAKGGIVVGKVETGSKTTFKQSFDIPADLAGRYRIAIRLDSPQGYYSYNWFYNDVDGTKTPGYTGIPIFNISEVEKDVSVTVITYNLPPGVTFTVRMGEYGTRGVGGIKVGTLESGEGGTLTPTFNIPAELAGKNRIAIRMDSATGYYYAFNWFWNNSTSVPVPPEEPVYTGIPTFFIAAVVKNESVTITAKNFPPDQTFKVRMGEYGTLGIGGIEVATYESGEGGAFSATYEIPDELAGRNRIAIRLETANGYFYAFNWFYNNTTD